MATIPSVIDLTRELVRFDTVNPPGGERACSIHLGAMLEAAGFHVGYDEFAPQRTSLVARLGGHSERLPICFSGHVDTVPFGVAPWERAPLSAELCDGRVYGRGTSDMKGGVAAMVVAALRLAPRLARSSGVTLVLSAGEETSCQGVEHLSARPDLLQRAGALVVGEPTANYPYLGHKGTLWIEAKTRGVTAHGSMPERGVNAIYKAAHAVCQLESLEIVGPPHPIMGRVTLNVGTIHGGLNVNSVPDEATFCVDLRSVPGVRHAQILEQIRDCVGAEVELRVTSDDEGIYTDPSHAWVQRVYDITAATLGSRPEPKTLSYFTDGAALGRAYGRPPTVILGPGEPQLAHQTNEYCLVHRLEEAVSMYSEILVDWCGL